MGILLAALKYLEAVKLAPEDATSLSNLSAVYYEMGLYTKSIQSIETALKIPATDELTSKLRSRLLRSLLQAQMYEQVDEALRHPLGQVNDVNLLSTINQSKVLIQIGKRKAMTKVVTQLPRYMPKLIPGCEYYTIGYDVAEV